MNQIFLGKTTSKMERRFYKILLPWQDYTTLKFTDDTTQSKDIYGPVTWQNIEIKNNYNDADTSLTYCKIGKNITEINEHAFSYYWSLTAIDIPNVITSIGDYAFQNCSSLISVEIPDSVSSLSKGLFGQCYSLSSVTIPNSVTSIGYATFLSCISLSSIDIPSSVTSIGSDAFWGSSHLTSVIFEGKALSDITSMTNYPWGIKTSAIIPGIS